MTSPAARPLQRHRERFRFPFAYPGAGFAASVAATGSITCGTNTAATDGDSVTIGDGMNPAVTYEYDKSSDGVTAGHVTWAAGTTADSNSLALQALIAANQPGLTVTDNGSGVLTITHKWPGAGGNVTITKSGTGAVSAVTGMSGGLAAVATTITATTTYKTLKVEGHGLKIERVELLLPAGLTQDPTNYATFELLDGATVMASWSTQTTTGQGTIAANTPVDLVLSSTVPHRYAVDGDQLSLSIVVTGTVTVPAGLFVVEGYEL